LRFRRLTSLFIAWFALLNVAAPVVACSVAARGNCCPEQGPPPCGECPSKAPHPERPATLHCVVAPTPAPGVSVQAVTQQADWLGGFLPPANTFEWDPGQGPPQLRISESPFAHGGDTHVYLLTRRLRL
jgi:hypothetical protein